jgi:hypothetical protein
LNKQMAAWIEQVDNRDKFDRVGAIGFPMGKLPDLVSRVEYG